MTAINRFAGIFVLFIALAAATSFLNVGSAAAEGPKGASLSRTAMVALPDEPAAQPGPWFPIPDDFVWICDGYVFECKVCDDIECQAPAARKLVARDPGTVEFKLPLDFLWLCDGWVFECEVVCVGNTPCLDNQVDLNKLAAGVEQRQGGWIPGLPSNIASNLCKTFPDQFDCICIGVSPDLCADQAEPVVHQIVAREPGARGPRCPS